MAKVRVKFYVSPKTDTSLHKHNYAEVHILGEGRAEFLIDNQQLTRYYYLMDVLFYAYEGCTSLQKTV